MNRLTVPLLAILGLILLPVFAAPSSAAGANDFVGSAKRIKRVPFSTTAETTDATRDGSDPTSTCGDPTDGVGYTVWYKLKLRKGATIEATTLGSDYDTVLTVYTRSGTRENLTWTEVICDDDLEPLVGASRVSITAKSGTAYFILVAAYGTKGAGHIELGVAKATT